MTLHEWPFKSAKDWQFWLPQSGIVGGVIVSIVLTGFAYLTIWTIKYWGR